MSWDSKPPTPQELQSLKASPAPSATSGSWDSMPPTPEELSDKAASPEDSVGVLEAYGRGALQAGTAGFADEITGGVEHLLTGKPYDQARDESRANNQAAQEQHPVAYGAGNLTGGVATAFVPGMGAATAGGRIAMGAGLGAVNGLGSSDADLTKGDVGGAAVDAATGGLMGGAVSGALESISPLSKYLSGVSKSKANELAAESLKGSAKQYGRLGEEGVQKMGAGLLDNGLVKAGSNAKESLGRIRAFKSNAEEGLQNILEGADASIPSDAVAQRITDEVMPNALTTGGSAAVNATEKAIGDVGAVEARTLPELNLLGSNISKKAYGAPTTTAETLAKKQSERVIDGMIKEAVPAEQHAALDAANSSFGLGAEAEKLARVGASRYRASNGFSLGDKIAAAVGGGLFGPKGMAIGLANKAIRERGQSTAAVGLDKLSQMLTAAPEMFGSYGPALKEAAAKGSNSLAVHNYLLSQRDPKYREMLENLQKTQQPEE
jgi:hypothetical protein